MVSKSITGAFPWGSVSFALALATVFAYYAQGVYVEARGTTDWMLIVPAAAIGITALLINAGTKTIDWYRHKAQLSHAKPENSKQQSPLLALLFMGLLALYVALIPSIGFDLGSVIFVFLSLYMQGEKRFWVLSSFSVAVSAIVVVIFIVVLNLRLPTLLFSLGA